MDIEKIINDVEMLKPVSHIGNKTMEIVSNPDSSLTDIVDVIKYDQGMTANLLKTCNSSYFGLRKEIVSIKQAVAYLGIEKVACLIMLGNHAGNFNKDHSGYDLHEGELWRYSVSSALIAQDLAEKRNLKNISGLFTSALLKDIGKSILNTYMKDAIEDVKSKVANDGLTFIESEKEIFGIDHAELGAKVAEKWHFSDSMVDTIRNHHTPERSSSTDLTLPIIYLADTICMMIGVGVGADGLAYRYQQDIVDKLNFSDIDLQKTIADFWEKLKSIEELVKLSGGN
jgi:putative nucleotidyltransferase with HDIG domain